MDVTYSLTFFAFFGCNFFLCLEFHDEFILLRRKNKAEESYFDLNYMDVEDIWYQGLHGSKSDLTRGLRLEVQADGEFITNGTVDAMEEVECRTHSLLVLGADVEDVDTLLNQLQDGFDEEFSDSEAV